ncbi:hypothetical protein GGG16DRAFT_106692 [Schizophyllum commune]
MAPDADGHDEAEVANQVLQTEEEEARAAARGRLELVRISYEDNATAGIQLLLPPNMRSLKGRVRHYATRANLQLEEVVDCGRSGAGGAQRFTIKSALMRPLRDTKPASQIDPGEAFLRRLESAPSLEELQLAWVGITNRLANSQKVYNKYWSEALRQMGDEEAEVLTQPASTPSTVYRQIDREEDDSRRLRLALEGLPSSRASALNQDRARDTQRFLNQPAEDLVRLDTPLREAFPERPEEDNPLLRFYDDEGRPHAIPPNTTHNNPLDYNPVPPQEGQESLDEDPPGFFVETQRPSKSTKKKARPSTFGLMSLRAIDEDDEPEDETGGEGGAPPPPPPPSRTPGTSAGPSRKPKGTGANPRGGGGRCSASPSNAPAPNDATSTLAGGVGSGRAPRRAGVGWWALGASTTPEGVTSCRAQRTVHRGKIGGSIGGVGSAGVGADASAGVRMGEGEARDRMEGMGEG